MVVYNANDKDETVATGRYHERIGNATKATNVITGEKTDLAKLELKGKSTLILELSR